MPPGSHKIAEKSYASCQIIKPLAKPEILNEKVVRHFNDKYDNYNRQLLSNQNSTTTNLVPYTSTETANEDDVVGISEEERIKIEICFRGLKTQIFVCNSLTNLYYGDTAHEGNWQLQYTGIPVVILDTGETRSRLKRRIQIILAERGTCFTLWQDIIDNLSSYKVAGDAFHTMFLSSDHRKIIGLSFDSLQAANELWLHIDRLTSCPENISLSVPSVKNKKQKKQTYPPLPEKSNISQPCCFQHITNVDLNDRSRYFSLQTLLPVLPHISKNSKENSSDL